MELLIEELKPSESNIITEVANDAKTGKKMYLNGIFMQSEVLNRNQRKYPLNEITNAVSKAQAMIKEQNGIFGELDHPQTLQINLKTISHVITDLRMEGTNAIGRAVLLDTPAGLIGQELIKSGVRIGVSSRGAGELNESVVSNFNFVTVDIVATPSAPGALPNSIYESLEMNPKGRKVLTLAETLQEDPEAQEYFKKAFLNFLKEGLYAKR